MFVLAKAQTHIKFGVGLRPKTLKHKTKQQSQLIQLTYGITQHQQTKSKIISLQIGHFLPKLLSQYRRVRLLSHNQDKTHFKTNLQLLIRIKVYSRIRLQMYPLLIIRTLK